MTGGGYPDGIRPIVDDYAAGRRDAAIEGYQRWLPLINYENRQCGLLAAKILMKEGGVIRSDAPRHPFAPVPPESRQGSSRPRAGWIRWSCGGRTRKRPGSVGDRGAHPARGPNVSPALPPVRRPALGIVGNRWACGSTRARAGRARSLETKFHSRQRGPSGGSPATSAARRPPDVRVRPGAGCRSSCRRTHSRSATRRRPVSKRRSQYSL